MMIMRVKTTRVRKKKPRLVKGMLKYFVLALIIFGSAFITVKQRNSVTKMGYELGQLQNRSQQLERERRALELQFTELKQPDVILRKIEKFRLKLVRIEASQKKELPKPKPIDANSPKPPDSDTERKNNEESRVVRN